MKPMLFSQRMAYAQMGRWRPAHRVLWAAYEPFSRFAWARALWWRYRRHWPKYEGHVTVGITGRLYSFDLPDTKGHLVQATRHGVYVDGVKFDE